MNENEWERFEPIAFVMLMGAAIVRGDNITKAVSIAEDGIKCLKVRFPPKEDDFKWEFVDK